MKAVIFLLLFVTEAFAHGTGYRQSTLKAIPLEFMYSTGEAMSYREAKVFSPDDEKFAFQTGRTDEHGRFAFTPDKPGKWRVIVRDEEGHQCVAEVEASGDASVTASDSSQSQTNSELLVRALLGVSVIFNIALIIRRHHAH